eukprot:7106772-Prymnesium_polylepis.1
MPGIASLFDVDERQLLMRDMYSARAQHELASHWDESCFSFVVQLNSLGDFVGGGTLFAHAGGSPISVAPGEALLFCGYNPHSGVSVTSGTRYILTGFVDYRASAEAIGHFDNGVVPFSMWKDLPNPSLLYNVRFLSAAYGATGVELLRRIAAMPEHVPNLDCAELAACCAAWLNRGQRASEPRLQRFIDVVSGAGAAHYGRSR